MSFKKWYFFYFLLFSIPLSAACNFFLQPCQMVLSNSYYDKCRLLGAHKISVANFDFLANSPRNEVTSRNFFTHCSATIFNFVRMVKTGQDNLLLFTIQSPSEVGKSCFTQPFFISFVKSGKFIGKKLHISF